MSQENVEIVRRVVQEFAAGMERGDPGAAFDTGAIADDYEHVLEVNELEGRSVWRGRKGFVEFVRAKLSRSWACRQPARGAGCRSS
jgi:hypothetical protein